MIVQTLCGHTLHNYVIIALKIFVCYNVVILELDVMLSVLYSFQGEVVIIKINVTNFN